ncbi:MAG: DnaD domain-containing protein [Syntrophaceticus sp.]|jgi:DNA replication protein
MADFIQLLHLSEVEIQGSIDKMRDLGVLTDADNSIETIGLFEKVADLWAEEKVQAEQNKQQHAALAGQFKQRPSPLMKVINLFEREFGRALTPIEIDKINNWYYDNGYADNLINEALKRAVLRGILNMNYIDKILASWAKMNIRTTREIIEYEEKFLNKKKQVRRVNRETVKSQDEKFKDIYLT